MLHFHHEKIFDAPERKKKQFTWTHFAGKRASKLQVENIFGIAIEQSIFFLHQLKMIEYNSHKCVKKIILIIHHFQKMRAEKFFFENFETLFS